MAHHHLPTVPGHGFSERLSPAAVMVFCECGRWSYQTTRRQNALARAAKIKGAKAAHLKIVNQQKG